MKTISELRHNNLGKRAKPNGIRIKSLNENYKLDFNVFLPSINKNLQRDLVWTLFQKREIIWSILLERHIPNICAINTYNETLQIIDGKQRLSAMLDYINDKFTLEISNEEYLFSQLPLEYQREISCFTPIFLTIDEHSKLIISDQEKINWFALINFAGTPQDIEHMNNLKK